jgi:hypothetical protein
MKVRKAEVCDATDPGDRVVRATINSRSLTLSRASAAALLVSPGAQGTSLTGRWTVTTEALEAQPTTAVIGASVLSLAR